MHLHRLANPFFGPVFDFPLDIYISDDEECRECLLLGVIAWIQDDVVWLHVEFNERVPGHCRREQSILLAHDLSKSLSLEKEFNVCIILALSVFVVPEVLELCAKVLHWDVDGLIVWWGIPGYERDQNQKP